MIMEVKEVLQGKISIILNIVSHKMYPKEWRYGQACFNLFYLNFPQQVDILRGTDKDCFYDNNKVELFINSITEQLEQAKSIKDIEREAFDAGREGGEPFDVYDNFYKYETFEDYIKSKENGTTE